LRPDLTAADGAQARTQLSLSWRRAQAHENFQTRMWPELKSVLIQFFRRTRALLLASALALPLAGCGKANSTTDTSPIALPAEAARAFPSTLTVFDLAGHPVNPFGAENDKAMVWIFVRTDCPISNRYAPEIRRLEETFARTGVKFWLVYPDADAAPDAIEQHLKNYQLPRNVLRDPRHDLVRIGQVRVTPEAAVFLPGRRLVYHGRIDNRYVDLGKERPEATQHDLQNVLEAILQGKPVPYRNAKAVGCYLSDLK